MTFDMGEIALSVNRRNRTLLVLGVQLRFRVASVLYFYPILRMPNRMSGLLCLQQQGRRLPSLSSSTARWIRRLRVAACFAEATSARLC